MHATTGIYPQHTIHTPGCLKNKKRLNCNVKIFCDKKYFLHQKIANDWAGVCVAAAGAMTHHNSYLGGPTRGPGVTPRRALGRATGRGAAE